MVAYRKSFKYYIFIVTFIIFSLYLVWITGRLFITNITVSKPQENSFKIYQNDFSFKPLPIYILQLGVYNNIDTAQNDAKKFSSKGVVTYLTNHGNYRLIADIHTKENYLKVKKEQLEKKGLSLFEAKDLILNDKQIISVRENDNMHNQLNTLYLKYSQWLCNNELYWLGKEKVIKSSTGEGPATVDKETIIIEFHEIDSLLNRLIQEVKDEKLKARIKNLLDISKQYKDNLINIPTGSVDKGINLAKGQYLGCWDQFQYLYEYLSDDRKVSY